MNTIEVDPRRCPLCGGPNDCGIAAGASTCWCFSTDVPAEVVARVPDEARDAMCICRACAEGQSAAANSSNPAGLIESEESEESAESAEPSDAAERVESATPSARIAQTPQVDAPLRPDAT